LWIFVEQENLCIIKRSDLLQENPECRKHFSDNTFLKGATLEEGASGPLNALPLSPPGGRLPNTTNQQPATGMAAR
jgi:hypothetical protein